MNFVEARKDTIRFKCPKCDSCWFGSSGLSDETMTRHCHDEFEKRCDFECHLKDDYTCFLINDVAFKNQEEYEKAHREYINKINMTPFVGTMNRHLNKVHNA